MAIYRLTFTPEAVDDISSAAKYYEEQQQGLGKRFRSMVKNKLLSIRETPHAYAIRYDIVRFALVDIFPYSIHFIIHDETRTVRVYAVLCQYRNPMDFWKGFDT